MTDRKSGAMTRKTPSQFDFQNYDYLDSLEGLPMASTAKVDLFSFSYLRNLLPGLATALMVALAALFLAQHYLAPAVFFALFLGLAVNFLASVEQTRPGLDFAAKNILRIGIAISGARLTFQEIGDLGFTLILAVIAIVAATFFSGILLARALRLPRELGILGGGAVAICGASAALAVSSVLPRSRTLEMHTVFVIVCVASMSTLAMIAYPILAASIGLSDVSAGVFFGASIHDVAQVLGAGYAVSGEAGEAATVTKLLRVALLFPIVALIALWARAQVRGVKISTQEVPKLPFFLIAFVIIVGANSVGLISAPVGVVMTDTARFFLVLSVAALGVRTRFEALREVGLKPFIMIALQTAFMAALALAFVTIQLDWS